MPRIVSLRTFKDDRGSLTVVEKETGFAIRRVFYIYDVKSARGGHGHKRTRTALIAVSGTVVVKGQSPVKDFEYVLESPDQCVLLEVEDWHTMEFSQGAVLLVLASEEFSPSDYFYEKYRN
jgi:hypothetical protein